VRAIKLKALSLEAAFTTIIVVASIVFVVGLPLAHKTFCNFSETTVETQAGAQPNAKQYTPDQEVDMLFLSQKVTAQNDTNNAGSEHELPRHTWLCDVHITDIFLLYFTFCLVIIGYFTMRSADRTVKNTERAIIFGGPIGHHPNFPAPRPNPAKPYSLAVGVTNYGRTIGILKEFYIEFSLIEPTEKKAVYDPLKGMLIKTDTGVLPGVGEQNGFLGYASTDTAQDQYCYGYVKYLDIFRQPHIARFCVKIAEGPQIGDVAGTDAYNEWD
jgi:hypothetical protein